VGDAVGKGDFERAKKILDEHSGKKMAWGSYKPPFPWKTLTEIRNYCDQEEQRFDDTYRKVFEELLRKGLIEDARKKLDEMKKEYLAHPYVREAEEKLRKAEDEAEKKRNPPPVSSDRQSRPGVDR
jgi:hypothetical protein